MNPKVQDFNKHSLAQHEPPSHWEASEKYLESKRTYEFDPWKFIGKYPWSVLDGDKSEDATVKKNLQKVARLQGWKQHLQFGLFVDTNSSICRINLGFDRGFTNWISLIEMAHFLDESEFIEAAKEKHRKNLKRRHSQRLNYTIGVGVKSNEYQNFAESSFVPSDNSLSYQSSGQQLFKYEKRLRDRSN